MPFLDFGFLEYLVKYFIRRNLSLFHVTCEHGMSDTLTTVVFQIRKQIYHPKEAVKLVGQNFSSPSS